MSDEVVEKLTGKQKAFADFYLGDAHFVGVKAAKLAGYNGNYSSLAQIAWENLKKPRIRAYLEARLTALTMSSNEVLAKLTAIANGSIEDVLDDEGAFDFEEAKKRGVLPLVKKLKQKDGEIEFEMYSAHEALRDLGKYHKLFTDKVEHGGSIGTYSMSKEEWELEAANKINQVENHLGQFEDDVHETEQDDPDS